MKTSEMAFLSNSRWKNRKERQNRTTSNGDIAEIAVRPVSELMNFSFFYLSFTYKIQKA